MQETVSIVQIQNLLAKIAYLSDQGTPEDYLACFTDDAVWDLASGEGLPMSAVRIVGYVALLKAINDRRKAGIQGPGSHTAHTISTTSIDFDGDTATAISIFTFYTQTNSVPVLAGVGRYTDTFAYSNESWRLKNRKITRD